MIKAITIADMIAYHSKMSMAEVFLSNVAVLITCNVTKKWECDMNISYELCKIFRNDYGLDQLRERLLLKESYTIIYYLLGTGKLPRTNNS